MFDAFRTIVAGLAMACCTAAAARAQNQQIINTGTIGSLYSTAPNTVFINTSNEAPPQTDEM